MSELSGRRTSAAAAIRFACSSAGILFGEPFGNHSKFQVVIRMTAPSPSDEASETNATINVITSRKVRESMCGAGEQGLSHSQCGAASGLAALRYRPSVLCALMKNGDKASQVSVSNYGPGLWEVTARAAPKRRPAFYRSASFET
jgi:hypothetical protein